MPMPTVRVELFGGPADGMVIDVTPPVVSMSVPFLRPDGVWLAYYNPLGHFIEERYQPHAG